MVLATRQSAKPANTDEEGYVVLGVNKVYKLVIWFFLGMGLTGIIIMVIKYKNPYTIQEVINGIIAFAVLVIPISLLFQQFVKNHIVRFNEDEIIVKNWRGREQKLTWDEVEYVKFRRLAGYLSLYGADKRLSVQQHQTGLPMLLMMIEKKKGIDPKSLGIPMMNDIKRPHELRDRDYTQNHRTE